MREHQAEKRLLARWKATGPKQDLGAWCYWEAIRLEAAQPSPEKIEEVAKRIIDEDPLHRGERPESRKYWADCLAALLREALGGGE